MISKMFCLHKWVEHRINDMAVLGKTLYTCPKCGSKKYTDNGHPPVEYIGDRK